jgi:hypothetical protein
VTLLIDRDDPADVARGMEFHDRVVRGALQVGRKDGWLSTTESGLRTPLALRTPTINRVLAL